MKRLSISLIIGVFVIVGWVGSVWAEGPDLDLTFGLGMLSGDTTYQIGGNFSAPGALAVTVHFPISELEFPLDIFLLSVRAGLVFDDRVRACLEIKKSFSQGDGKMKDSDWGSWWLYNYPDVYAWARQDSLDVYSESDAELDVLIWDVNLRCDFIKKPKWTVSGGIGYKRQNFNYYTSDVDQWYPSYTEYATDIENEPTIDPNDKAAASGHVYAYGKVLSYEVTYTIPYIEIAAAYHVNQNFNIEGSVGFSPLAGADDVDVHILRAKVSEGDCNGDAFIYSLKGSYGFSKSWSFGLQLDYTRIDTEGESKSYVDGAYSHTIEQKTFSDQLETFITLGYTF